MPVYLIETPTDKRLVRAITRTTAVNYVVKDTVKSKAVTADEMLDFINAGIKVEQASERKEIVVKDEAFIPPEPVTAEDLDGMEKAA